tara:strand:+ start:17039 stop:17632 length:594 start_codon:yes stop_codon:yes gene_type:complete
MENYGDLKLKVRAPCPSIISNGCAPIAGQTEDSISTDLCGNPSRGPCLYNENNKLITGTASPFDDSRMCEYDLNVDENTLKNYEALGYKPNYNGEPIDIYDPDDVVESVAEKIYNIEHEHEHKKGGVSSFERILIIIGIVLFSLLILVSGILIYRNIRGPNLANNVRQNINSVGRNTRNNVTIAEKNLVKLMKSAKK